MAAARLFTEMHNSAGVKAVEHPGALPPRVEEHVYSQREQAANIPSSNVVRIAPGLYRVMSPRNNDSHYVDLNALKSGDRIGSCDCGFLVHCRSAFCLHQAAACNKESLRIEDWLPDHQSTLGWRNLHSLAPPLQVPTAAEIDAHSALVDENLLICPCLPNRTGAPKKGKRIPGVFDLIQRPKKKRKITCSICRKRGHNKLQCKNTETHLRR